MIPLLPILIKGGQLIGTAIAGKIIEKVADKTMDDSIEYIKEGKTKIVKNHKIKQLAKGWIKEIESRKD